MKRVIIYAGVASSTWDTEARILAHMLEEVGFKVLGIIPINRLDCPRVEYIPDEYIYTGLQDAEEIIRRNR